MTRFSNFATGRRSDERLREEMEEHLTFLADENLRAGMSAAEARRQALLKFGGATSILEDYHSEESVPSLESLLRDGAYGLRLLARSPGFAATAILTMAVCIGATTAIFSVVDATLLHPLPYAHPEQLVRIQDDLPGIGSRDVGMSMPEWHDLEHSGVFDSISPVWFDDQNLTGSAAPARVGLLIVGPNYFSMLGVKPQLGSTFRPDDPTPGVAEYAVISDGLWKRGFGGDPRVLGKEVRLDTDLYQVIGVMPPGFRHPGLSPAERNVDVWVSGGFAAPPFSSPEKRSSHFGGAIGRVKAGVSMTVAQSKVDVLVASLRKQFPSDYPAESAWIVRLIALRDSVAGSVRQSLYLLLGSVGLVLLIGCVNIANLLLARGSARTREMAIRQALGAGRARLTRQLLTESLLLSVIGGLTGLVVLYATKGFLLQLVPESLPRLTEISITWDVLLFTLSASVLSGAFFGMAPALHARKLDIAHGLKQEGRSNSGSWKQGRTRRLLVVTEFALSLILMITATLLERSFWALIHVPLGFNPQSVMAVRTRLPYPNDIKDDLYRTVEQKSAFVHELLRRARTLPGVMEVAIGNSTSVPLDHARQDENYLPVLIEGRGTIASAAPLVDSCLVTPEYFRLMGMPIERGRFFNDFDTEKTAEVAVINAAMAQMFWPNEDAIGKRLRLNQRASSWATVVGIVANARAESLENAGIPQIYSSLYQRGSKRLVVFLKGHLDTATIPGRVRAEVQAVDRRLPVFSAQTLERTVSTALDQRRFSAEMVGVFALVALLLAALGIYGVIAYMVGERTHEIGIRLALGADRSRVMVMILRQGTRLTMTGAATGLAGAWIVSHLMTGLLFDISPGDPLTFAGVTVLFAAIALAACYVPARRVMQLDPLIALRRD